MKKVILLAWALTFITSVGMTQKNNKILVGVKGGVNFSSVYDPHGDDFEVSPKFGLAAGAFFGLGIGEYTGLQSEILFSQRRFSASGTVLGAPYQLTRTATYIDVPVFITVTPTEFLTIMAGPQYSYLTHEKNVFGNTEFKDDETRKNILCFVGGADINQEHFVISARVGWDILSNTKKTQSTALSYKNVWYQFMLGYKFY